MLLFLIVSSKDAVCEEDGILLAGDKNNVFKVVSFLRVA